MPPHKQKSKYMPSWASKVTRYITYAGSITWLVSGAIQVNVKLPDEFPGTNYGEYPIALRVGNSLSPFVYIPVKTH